MANDVNKAFEVDSDGILIEDGPYVIGGSASPVGIDAPLKTIYIQEETDGIKIWKHFTTNPNDWQTTNSEIYANSPPPLVLSHNGTLSNNQLVGYTNLANNAVVVGFKSKLLRITCVTRNTTPDYSLDFFDGEADGGNNNGFYRFTVANATPIEGFVTGSPTFDAGDRLGIYYRDEGVNANDLNLVLFFEAIE